MAEEKRSFWDRLFGRQRSPREEKILEYVIHRIEEGANLEEVLQEEYVRRTAGRDEIRRILDNPRLVEAAGEQLREDFTTRCSAGRSYGGGLDPGIRGPIGPGLCRIVHPNF